MEILGGLVMALGGLISLVGWIWLVVLGFQKGGALWGILNFLFSPLSSVIFCIMHKTGWMQLAMMIIGGILAGVGMVPVMMKAMENMPR